MEEPADRVRSTFDQSRNITRILEPHLKRISQGCAVAATLLLVAACTDDSALPSGSKDSKAHFKLEARAGQPAVEDGILYIGTEAGVLHAVDLDGQLEIWRTAAAGPVMHAPYVGENLVLYGSQDGRLRAIDKQTGALQWEFAAGEVDWEVRDIFINGTPNVIDGVAYFSSEDFNVYAVDVKTGQEIWRHTLGEEPQAWHLPVVNGVAYVGAWDGFIYAIDIDTGTRVWRSATDDTNRAAKPKQVPHVTVVPVITEDAVYFTDWAGNLFSVDRRTGEQIWRFDPGTIDVRHAGSRSFLLLHDDDLYYSTVRDRHLYGVNRFSGQQVWSVETEGIVYGPGPAGDSLGFYFEQLNDGMHLRVFDFEERSLVWSASDVAGPPAVVASTIYYATTNGEIVARNLITGRQLEISRSR